MGRTHTMFFFFFLTLEQGRALPVLNPFKPYVSYGWQNFHAIFTSRAQPPFSPAPPERLMRPSEGRPEFFFFGPQKKKTHPDAILHFLPPLLASLPVFFGAFHGLGK